MEEKKYRYDAFISYRHTVIDEWIAKKLHKKLETFKVPKAIKRQIGNVKISRVFRDREELTSAPSLSDELEKQLCSSHFLILICSSQTKASPWVMKEVTTFKTLYGQERILLLMVEGDAEEIIPDELTKREKTYETEKGEKVTIEEAISPLAADIRASSKSKMLKKLDEEILRLIAPILGCRYDDLKQRHKERKRKRLLAIGVAVMSLLLCFGTFNAWRVKQIEEQMRARLATMSRALADQSLRLFDEGNRIEAILVAQEALPKNLEMSDRPIMEEPLFALSEALYVYNFDFMFVPNRTLDYTRNLYDVKASPSGKYIATASEEDYIEIWDLEKDDLKRIIHRQYVDYEDTSFEFLDNTSLVYYSDSQIIAINIETGKELWKLEEIDSYGFEISEDKSKLLVLDDNMSLYSTKDGKQEICLPFEGDIYTNNKAAWNKTMTLLAVKHNDLVRIFDLREQKWIASYKPKYEKIAGIVFTADNRLVIASNDQYKDELSMIYGISKGTLEYVELNQDKVSLLWQMDFNENMIGQLKYNGQDAEQLTLVKDNVFEVIDLEKGQVEYSFAQSDYIVDYELVEGKLAICGMADGNVKTCVLDVGNEFAKGCFKHQGEIKGLCFTDGKIILTCRDDKKAYIYSSMKTTPKFTLEDEEGILGKVNYSKNGKYMCTYSTDRRGIRIWDTRTRQIIQEIPSEVCKDIGFIGEEDKLYIAEGDNEVKVWDIAEGKFTIEVTSKNMCHLNYDVDSKQYFVNNYSTLRCIDLDEKGKYKDYGLTDITKVNQIGKNRLIIQDMEKIYYYNTESMEQQVITEEPVEDYCISEDGFLAIYFKDRHIEIIEINSGKVVESISNDGIELSYFSFSGEKLWMAYVDDTVWEYDLKEKMNKQLVGSFKKPIVNIEFYRAASRFVLYTEGREAIVYSMDKQKKLAHIKGCIGTTPNCESFLLEGYKEVAIIPYYTPEMLLEEANKQLKGRILTDQEKRNFFIQE